MYTCVSTVSSQQEKAALLWSCLVATWVGVLPQNKLHQTERPSTFSTSVPFNWISVVQFHSYCLSWSCVKLLMMQTKHFLLLLHIKSCPPASQNVTKVNNAFSLAVLWKSTWQHGLSDCGCSQLSSSHISPPILKNTHGVPLHLFNPSVFVLFLLILTSPFFICFLSLSSNIPIFSFSLCLSLALTLYVYPLLCLSPTLQQLLCPWLYGRWGKRKKKNLPSCPFFFES